MARRCSQLAFPLLIATFLVACGNGSPDATSSAAETGPLRIVGGGTAPFRERGADNSIEEYGHEASRAELQQAAATVHEYLIARVRKDWRAACSLSSRSLRHRIRDVFELAQPHQAQSCPEMLAVLAPGEPPIAPTTYEATKVEAGSLRVESRTGFLFFNADSNGSKLIVARDGDLWKPAGFLPTALH